MAFVYATGGNELFIEDVVVDIAKRVVTVRATLAGAQKMLLKMVTFHYLDNFPLELIFHVYGRKATKMQYKVLIVVLPSANMFPIFNNSIRTSIKHE